MNLTFTAIAETRPGPKWADLFQRSWPAYKSWWLSQGERERPTYLTCYKALKKHMPEFLPVYEFLAELAGGGDYAARFLSLYRPPPYLSGCSQAVWSGSQATLVRNYDYKPEAFDAVILRTQWLEKSVLGMSDCLIGLLDGINEDGLTVSLTFGGRRVVGPGFGIPMVLRYILETCSRVSEGVKVLQRVPCHMAYNVTLLDHSGQYKTVFVGPDRPAVVTDAAAATNHQQMVEWKTHAAATSSVEREAFLLDRLERQARSPRSFVAAFGRPPLYSPHFDRGFGTLYTAAYRPSDISLELRWPGVSWPLSMARFKDQTRLIEYAT